MSKKVLMSGNEAIAEGALTAGCRFYAGYPITPQNEIPAYMAAHMPKAGGVFIQAESELAAINMVFGAAAAGARAMTSSSSPGISLKQEGISYIAGAELPAVIVNVMRGGPGLGNIAPAQSDYFQATRGGGHGDYRCIVLAPYSAQEGYDLIQLAFELSDMYRNPALILGDAMLGQMMEPVVIKSHVTSRTSQVKKPWALTGCKDREPNIVRSFYLAEGALEECNLRLQAKYAEVQKKEVRYQAQDIEGAKVVVVAYGTMARIVKGAVAKLRADGKRVATFRPITLWPYPAAALRTIAQRKKAPMFLVVEMSYGQMLEDVRLAVDGKARVAFLGRGGGGIPSEDAIIREIRRLI